MSELAFGVDASVNLSIDAALGQLPLPTQNLLRTAQQTFSDIGPLAGIASMIASGHPIDEAQIMAGLTTVATMANPLAGAAIGAVGGLVTGINQGMQDLFSSFGWIDPPARTYAYTGYRRTGIDPVPYGKNDPGYWHINSNSDLFNVVSGNAPPKRPALSPKPPWNVIADETLRFLLTGLGTPGSNMKMPVHGTNTPAIGSPSNPATYSKPSGILDPFELFFYSLYVKNLELWGNGLGFVPPRDLLRQAKAAWDLTHGSEATKTYQAADRFSALPSADGPPSASGRSAQFIEQSVVSMTIGTGGDFADGSVGNISRMAPLTVNMGKFTGVAAPPKKVVTLHFGSGGGTPAALPPTAVAAKVNGQPVAISPVVLGKPPPPHTQVVLVPMTTSIASRVLPYVPIAAGIALLPVYGVVAPVIGGALSALWVTLHKK
jgi:hypothetical protein